MALKKSRLYSSLWASCDELHGGMDASQSKNRAESDDILGDAYEYLMRHFATESGKSKGQFYTPAEVSRIMAQISGIRDAWTSATTTVYDPTCGSGYVTAEGGRRGRHRRHALRAGKGHLHQRPGQDEYDPCTITRPL